MAAPTIPIEIWAYEDVILPNTHELNKNRPINDLWIKGWDMGEKPAIEEFNYVLNMVTAWASYITGEQIPELDSRFLRISENLNDLSDKAISRTNLSVWSKQEADDRYVNVTGDTMTGTLTVPRLNFPATDSDIAYITTTTGSADSTLFDFVVGDNPGATPGSGTTDSIRFRFAPAGGSTFTMMELNAISATAALCRVVGNIVATGSVQASSMTATAATFTNGTVSNTWTVNTLQSTTTRATNVVASNNVATTTLNATSTATLGGLTVTGGNATVAGRNIVRRVNGITANANGDLTLPMPNPGITDVRFGTRVRVRIGEGEYQVPAGSVMMGGGFASTSNQVYWSAPMQKFINGSWVNVTQL